MSHSPRRISPRWRYSFLTSHKAVSGSTVFSIAGSSHRHPRWTSHKLVSPRVPESTLAMGQSHQNSPRRYSDLAIGSPVINQQATLGLVGRHRAAPAPASYHATASFQLPYRRNLPQLALMRDTDLTTIWPQIVLFADWSQRFSTALALVDM